MTTHRQVTIRVDDLTAEVDEGMADLVAACWRAGIDTSECCEETRPGLARLSLLSLDDMESFFDAVSSPEDEEELFDGSGWQWLLWVDGGLRNHVMIPRDRVAWATDRVALWAAETAPMVLPSPPPHQYRPPMPTVGSVPGDPDGVAVSTTDQSTITLWLQSGGATDLTREAAEQLAGLLMTAVRRLGG
jgi:hypothetical protein